MKYRIIGISAAAVLMVLTAVLLKLDSANPKNRIHQHLTARQPDAGCDCDGSELCTHLPLVIIDTEGQEIPGKPIIDEDDLVQGYTLSESGEEDISVTISFIDEEGVNHHPSDYTEKTSLARFRIRGNSSRRFDKKNYRVKLCSDEEGTLKNPISIMGMSEDDDWALHGPFLDKTLIRNYMLMNISAEIMGYAPNVRFCEVILDGEYQGVYLLMETIKESDYRVDLSDYQEGASRTSFILRLDLVEDFHRNEYSTTDINNYTFYTHKLEFSRQTKTGFSVLYPNELNLTNELLETIQREVSYVERGIYSADMLTGYFDYEKYFDVDSLVDYYILQEFLANNDAFYRSTYFYKDVRGKLVAGPVWDYNNILDNFFRTFDSEGFMLSNRSWYGRFMADESFVQRVIKRYRYLRETYLSEEYLLSYIDEVLEYLGPAIERNDEVWGYSYDPNALEFGQYRHEDETHTLEEVNDSSHEEAVERMKQFLMDRGAWLDTHIEDLKQYCHPSKTAAERVE